MNVIYRSWFILKRWIEPSSIASKKWHEVPSGKVMASYMYIVFFYRLQSKYLSTYLFFCFGFACKGHLKHYHILHTARLRFSEIQIFTPKIVGNTCKNQGKTQLIASCSVPRDTALQFALFPLIPSLSFLHLGLPSISPLNYLNSYCMRT